MSRAREPIRSESPARGRRGREDRSEREGRRRRTGEVVMLALRAPTRALSPASGPDASGWSDSISYWKRGGSVAVTVNFS